MGTVKSSKDIKITSSLFSFLQRKYKSNAIAKKTIPVKFQPKFDLS